MHATSRSRLDSHVQDLSELILQREQCEKLAELLQVATEDLPASSFQALATKQVQQHGPAIASLAASARNVRLATQTLQHIVAFWAAEASLSVSATSTTDPSLTLPDAPNLEHKAAADLAVVADMENGPHAVQLAVQLETARRVLCDTQQLLQCWRSCGCVHGDLLAAFGSGEALAKRAAAQVAQTRGVAMRMQSLLEHLGPTSQLGRVVKEGELLEVRQPSGTNIAVALPAAHALPDA